MSVSLSPYAGAGAQFFDNNGNPLAGGLIYTYAAGTTTPAATYTTYTGGTANANPIVLDSAGRLPAQIWLTAGSSYKFVLQTSLGSPIKTDDNVFAPSYVDLQLAGTDQVLFANSSGVVEGDTTLTYDKSLLRLQVNSVYLSRGKNNVSGSIALGSSNTLGNNVAGFNDTAVGAGALANNSVGSLIAAVGNNALQANLSGNSLTAIGQAALYSNTTGNGSTAAGQKALELVTTGSNNTAIGYLAGDSLTTGSNNLVLGYDADVSAAGVSNEITLGNSSVTSLRVPGLTLTAGAKWINNGTQTVAALVAAATAGAGARAVVTDANATTFHSIVAGGGANVVPVFSDGTNWRIG
jgi:hypothetical protein